MAREGVTYDQYKTVADQLKLDGVKPTVRKVRAELGTGSNATLLSHQKRYLEEQHPSSNFAIELPAPLIDAMKRALDDVSSKATAEIELNYQDAHNQLAEDAKLLSEAEASIDSLSVQLNECNSKAEAQERALEKALAASEKQVEDLQKQLNALSNKLDESIRAQEVARTESAKAQLQVERADKAEKLAEKRGDELTKELDSLKVLSSKAEKSAATAEAITKEQIKAINRMEKDLAKMATVAESHDKRYEDLQLKYEGVTAEKSLAMQQAAVAQALVANLEDQNKQLKSLLPKTK